MKKENPLIEKIEAFDLEKLRIFKGKAFEIKQTWNHVSPFSFEEYDVVDINAVIDFLSKNQHNCYYRLFNAEYDFCLDQGEALFHEHTQDNSLDDYEFFIEHDFNRYPGMKVLEKRIDPKKRPLPFIKGNIVKLTDSNKQILVFKEVVGVENGNT